MNSQLVIPDVDPDGGTLSAALAYAAAGWHSGNPQRLRQIAASFSPLQGARTCHENRVLS
jgi:hypothetical protein